VDVHRQATLLALDACQAALQQQKEQEEGKEGGREGGREGKAKLTSMVGSLKRRDRLLRVYQLVIDMTPEAVTEGGREGGREGGGMVEQVFASLTSTPSSLASSSSSSPSFAREEAAWAWLCPKEEEEEGMEEVLVTEYTHPLSVPAFLRACWQGGREDEEEEEEEEVEEGKRKQKNHHPPSPPLLGSSRTARQTHPHLHHQQEATAAAAAGAGAAAKERAVALRYLFRPLLQDVFALTALEEAISCLGWSPTQAMVGFGEWYLSLPPALAAKLVEKGGREGGGEGGASSSPVARWLGERIAKAQKEGGRAGGRGGGGGVLRKGALSLHRALPEEEEEEDDEDEEEGGEGQAQARAERLLDPLHARCLHTHKLEQAFSLTVLLRRLLLHLALLLEARSLGRYPSLHAGHRWQRLQVRPPHIYFPPPPFPFDLIMSLSPPLLFLCHLFFYLTSLPPSLLPSLPPSPSATAPCLPPPRPPSLPLWPLSTRTSLYPRQRRVFPLWFTGMGGTRKDEHARTVSAAGAAVRREATAATTASRRGGWRRRGRKGGRRGGGGSLGATG